MTWYLARWLANRGHEVTLFANEGSAVPGVEVIGLQSDDGPGEAARHDVSMPALEFMRAHRAYQALMLDLRRMPGRFDVVHSHSLHYLPVLMAELAPAPMALTLHCPPTPWLEAALADAGRDRPVLVAVSDATRELWHRCTPVSRVIRNGIDLARWQAGCGGDSLLWAGRIVREKAPHLAIEAAARAGSAIRLAGPIDDRAYWDAEVEPRLGDRASYVGHLAHDQLVRLVGASGALVVTPMWEEPFCLIAAEAMAVGNPRCRVCSRWPSRSRRRPRRRAHDAGRCRRARHRDRSRARASTRSGAPSRSQLAGPRPSRCRARGPIRRTGGANASDLCEVEVATASAAAATGTGEPMRLGWYIHHHGAGHLHRFLALRASLPGVVGISSLPRPATIPDRAMGRAATRRPRAR